MAILALAVVGAALAPAGYAAIGWSIGALAGQFLFQKKQPGVNQEGPRLGDTRIQAATYGVGIVTVEGSMRVAGNIIWTSGIRERVNQSSEEVGGKGGGGQEVTTTTYSYDVDLAIGLCEGANAGIGRSEIIGVRRIWANGTLIYNVADTADTATLIASNQNAQNIRFYTGSESQLADPTIEATLGAGNVPGYRGLAYAVFTQLQLAAYGNSLPNLEFEIVATGSAASLAKATTWTGIAASGIVDIEFDQGGVMVGLRGNSTSGLAFWNAADGAPLAAVPAASGTFKGWPNSTFNPRAIARDIENHVWALTDQPINNVTGRFLVRFSPDGVPNRIVIISSSGGTFPANEFKIDANGDAFFRLGSTIHRVRNLHQAADWNGSSTSTSYVESYQTSVGSGYGRAYLGADGLVHWLDVITGTYYTAKDAGLEAVAIAGFNVSANFNGLRWDQSGRVWAAWTETSPSTHPELKRFNSSTGAIDQSIVLPNGVTLHDFIFARDGFLWTNTGTWKKCLAADGTVLYSVTGTATNEIGGFSDFAVITVLPTAVSADLYLLEPLPRLTASSATTVADAVGRLCQAAGLTAGDVNVTALTDTLYGYIRGRPMSARAAIEPLARAFFFDAVESDGKIKFVKRGAPTPVTLDPGDFAREETGEDVPQLDYVRADEIDAPRQVTVNYFNRSADYLDATEYARRLVTRAQEQIFVELPIALTPDAAAQVADVLLYNAHAERTRYRWATGPKFIKYEPTDVFTITVGGIAHIARAIKKQEGNLLVEWEGLADYQSGYTSQATGATDQDTQSIVAIGGPTSLQILDIPILRDIDDDPGFYVAMAGAFDGWRGAQFFGSPDDSAFEAIGAVVTAAPMGYATTALADFPGGNIFDELNAVDVQFQNDTPASASELDVLNGANLALLGAELVQFKGAALVSGSTYRLTGLLRGRRGTEAGQTQHQAGDRFVMLATSAGMLRARRASSEIGVTRYYRAPSLGTPLAIAQSMTFANTGAGVKPLSAVYLRGFRNAALDITVSWIRRGRISWDWLNLADVPLGETSASYEVDVLNASGTVLRTIASSTETVTYTVAQQTTDFGSAQSSLAVRVYQLSATVGRGFAATGTV